MAKEALKIGVKIKSKTKGASHELTRTDSYGNFKG